MKKIFIFAALVFGAGFIFAQQKIEIKSGEKPVTNGWADMGKLSYPPAKNPVVVIDDATYPDPLKKRKAFTSAIAKGRSIVVLKGDVDLSDGKISDEDHSYFDEFTETGSRLHNDIVFRVSSDTAIIGAGNACIKFGGLLLKDVSNVIIRNVKFYDAHGSTEFDTKKKDGSKASIDNLSCERVSDIWVDHCSFSDGICVDLQRNYNHDGALDVKTGRFVTVSYCEFTNHDKVMLTAPGDSYTDPKDCLMTLHHNYFHGTTQRMPRSRGCNMHIYNNYYNEIGVQGNSGFSLGPGIASMYIVENNFFGTHKGAIMQLADKSKPGDSTYAKLYFSGNKPDAAEERLVKQAKEHLSDKKMWQIKYKYKLDDAEKLPDSLTSEAGAGKLVVIDGVEY